jgi:hypothetical protein
MSNPPLIPSVFNHVPPKGRDAEETEAHLERLRKLPMPTDNYAKSIRSTSTARHKGMMDTAFSVDDELTP